MRVTRFLLRILYPVEYLVKNANSGLSKKTRPGTRMLLIGFEYRVNDTVGLTDTSDLKQFEHSAEVAAGGISGFIFYF